MTQQIPLLSAYIWTCPNCSHEQFERAIVAELTPAQQREVAVRNNAPLERVQAGLVTYPDQVQCAVCGAEYDAEQRELFNLD